MISLSVYLSNVPIYTYMIVSVWMRTCACICLHFSATFVAVKPPAGLLPITGPELRTYAVHVQAAGYVTSYAGKYLNQYATASSGCGVDGQPACGGVPPGWDYWMGLVGNSKVCLWIRRNSLHTHGCHACCAKGTLLIVDSGSNRSAVDSCDLAG